MVSGESKGVPLVTPHQACLKKSEVSPGPLHTICDDKLSSGGSGGVWVRVRLMPRLTVTTLTGGMSVKHAPLTPPQGGDRSTLSSTGNKLVSI